MNHLFLAKMLIQLNVIHFKSLPTYLYSLWWCLGTKIGIISLEYINTLSEIG